MASIVNLNRYPDQSIYTININEANITVTVTASASVVEKWIETALIVQRNYVRLGQFIVGFAIDREVNTLQFCLYHSCLVFQIAHADAVPQILHDFMKHRFIGFPGIRNQWYRSTLKSKYEFELKLDPADLALWYGGTRPKDHSVNEMVLNLFGMKVNQREEIRTSNWGEKNLSDDQVIFACVETYCSYRIGMKFSAWRWGM